MAVAEHKKKNSLSNKPQSVSGRETHWAEVQEKAVRRSQRRNLRQLWVELEDPSAPLRWGVATALGSTSPTIDLLSRIAANLSDSPTTKSAKSDEASTTDLAAAGRQLLERLRDGAGKVQLAEMLEGLVWAYAMPELAIYHSSTITEELWWDLLGELQILHTTGLEQAQLDSPERLLASEIGAVLAWRLVDLHSCAALQEGSVRGIHEWFDESGHAVAAAVGGGGNRSRVVLASALRSRRLASKMKERLPLKKSGAAVDLATWVAALTRTDATMVLQSRGSNVRDDLGECGLFAAAIREVGGPSLKMASDASLGRLKSDGKLAWRVELPEPGWFEEDAGLAVMLPEWDVRRGRVAIHYQGSQCRIEVSGGKTPLIFGDWQVELKVAGENLVPTSNWSDVCWYSDDDVHYLEIEQSFTGGMRVQRQWMMLRDDQCLLMADAVVGGKPGELIEYRSSIPLVRSAHVEEERETRELFLVEGKVRAMVLPLALNEWRVGPAQGRLSVADETSAAESNSADNLKLVLEMRGDGAVYAPLWLDFDRKRLTKERTWRQLTVGQGLRLVPTTEGAAFRVQAGDDQWLVYRSLSGPANRTFMGKNLISEFFCGRFDGESGDVEELISVDEQTE